MVKDLISKEILWLGPEAEELLGEDLLRTRSKFHGRDFSLQSQRLEEVVRLLVRKHEVTRIIETGTFHGKGTTLTYARTGLPVYSCEAHRKRFRAAVKNLSQFENVYLSHAFTTRASEASAEFLENLGEENLPSDENWLPEALRQATDDRSLLVSLDSGGEVGLAEAKILIEWIKERKRQTTISLILDDIRFVKHEKTIPMLEEEFGVDVFQVENRWGFTVIQSPGH